MPCVRYLGEVPRSIWRSADITARPAAAARRVGVVAESLHGAFTALAKVVRASETTSEVMPRRHNLRWAMTVIAAETPKSEAFGALGSANVAAGGGVGTAGAAGAGAAAALPTSLALALQAGPRGAHVGAVMDYMGSKVVRGNMIPMDAVVKVFCTHTEPNYSLPWQRKRQVGGKTLKHD